MASSDKTTLKKRGSEQKPASSPAHKKQNLDFSDVDYVLVFSTKKKFPNKVLFERLKSLRDLGYDTSVQKGDGGSILIPIKTSESKLTARAALNSSASLETEKFSASLVSRRNLTHESLVYDGVLGGKFSDIVGGFIPTNEAKNGKTWSNFSTKLFIDPDTIKEDYGVQIGTLFAFFNYSLTLFLPSAVLGVAAQVFGGSYSLFFGILQLLWGITFCFGWRAKEKVLAHRWNVSSNSASAIDPRHTSANKFISTLKGLVFIPFAASLCGLYIFGCVVILAAEIFFTDMYNGTLAQLLRLAPAGANAAWAIVFGVIYKICLKYYMKYESFPTLDAADLVRARRQFYANFVINYTPLFLTAYAYLPFGHYLVKNYGLVQMLLMFKGINVKQGFELQTSRFSKQAMYFAVTNQLVGLFTDTVVPLVIQYGKLFLQSKKSAPTELQAQQIRPPFDVSVDLLAITSIFGFTLIAGPALPWFGAAALVGVALRTRASLFRLCKETTSPVSSNKATLGAWNSHLHFLAGVASITTPTLCFMYGGSDFTYGENSIVSTSILTLTLVAFFSENIFIGISKFSERYVLALVQQPTLPKGLQPRSVKSNVSDAELEKQSLIIL